MTKNNDREGSRTLMKRPHSQKFPLVMSCDRKKSMGTDGVVRIPLEDKKEALR